MQAHLLSAPLQLELHLASYRRVHDLLQLQEVCDDGPADTHKDVSGLELPVCGASRDHALDDQHPRRRGIYGQREVPFSDNQREH